MPARHGDHGKDAQLNSSGQVRGDIGVVIERVLE